MKTIEIAAIVVAVLLIVIIFFALVKGEKRKVSIINSDGSHVDVNAEMADSLFTRTKGLMGRQSLGETDGMLFIFDKPGRYSFWMLNTTIPLDAIFISENKTVVDIIAMDPCGFNVTKCRTYSSGADAKYVLEVNQGFSKKYGIVVNKSRLE